MSMQKLVLGAAAATCAGLWSTDAGAEIGSAPFNPSTEFRAEEIEGIETGYIGPSLLQVNLQVIPYQDVSIQMFGDAEYDFDTSRIQFIGTEDAGVFTNTLGADVIATVQVDLGFPVEFDLGLYSIDETEVANFTPYVLPGADPRPITVAETIGPFNLLDEDFTVPVFGNDANVTIDFHIEIPGISYESTLINITDDPESAVPAELGHYTVENSQLDLVLPNAAPGQRTSIWGQLNGLYSSEIAFVFTVNGTVIISDNPVTVGPYEIRVDVPIREDEPVTFDPEEMQFDVPEVPDEPDTDSDSDSDSTTGDDPTSDSDSDSDTTTGDDPSETTGEPSSDTDGGLPADGFGDSDTGCGCTTDRRPGGWGFGLAMLGLLALRRRRC
jgi:MYXO-CTERM domain-containing protein